MVLPTLILVTIVLVLLATALLAGGTTSLRVATHDHQADQASCAAEAGLVRGAEEFSKHASLPDNYAGDLALGCRYLVTAYENDGATPKPIPGGPTIPPSTVYLLAQGFSENGTSRKAGALFHMGLQAFQVGALADLMTASNSSFDAYNSERVRPDFDGSGVDPDAIEDDAAILASNTKTGTAFQLENVDVHGSVYVGQGGDPDSQIVKQGSVSIDSQDALHDRIDVDAIEVPGGEDADPDNPQIPTLRTFSLSSVSAGVWSFADSDGLSFSVNDDAAGGNNNNVDPGSLLKVCGTEELPGGQMMPYCEVHVSNEHYFKIQADGSLEYSDTDGNLTYGHSDELARKFFQDSAMVGGVTPGGSTTNPAVLETGRYDSVTVNDDWTTSMEDEGTYVIKDLIIEDGGKLKLPQTAHNVKIYVTGSLTVDGENALLNETRLPPNLKVYYTGSEDVNLAGGSNAYFTLIAPGADVFLTGQQGVRTQFYGALVGKNVTVENATFHYDTATSGIGTGTEGTGLTFINRWRL
jgi:hypothetical protein